MSWSYDDTLPAAKDRIRLMLGDVDEADPLISDEGIAMYVTGGALGQLSEALAAAECAGAIAAKFARRAMSISDGRKSVNWGDLASRYRSLAEQLRAADATGDGSAAFDIASLGYDDFSRREIIYDDVLRSFA